MGAKKYRLITAAKEGNISQVKELLLRKGLFSKKVDINAKGEYGATALISGAGMGHTDIVKVLLEAGADINAKDEDGNTSLMVAVASGQSAVFK